MKVIPNLFFTDTAAESSCVMEKTLKVRQIPIISPPRLDLSLSGNVLPKDFRAIQAAPGQEQKVHLCPEFGHWVRSVSPWVFNSYVITFYPSSEGFHSRKPNLLTEVETESIPGRSYIWNFFSCSHFPTQERTTCTTMVHVVHGISFVRHKIFFETPPNPPHTHPKTTTTTTNH